MAGDGLGGASGLANMDYFGEVALLHDVSRTATIRCREPVEVYSLQRADVRELLRRSSHLRLAIEHRMQDDIAGVPHGVMAERDASGAGTWQSPGAMRPSDVKGGLLETNACSRPEHSTE